MQALVQSIAMLATLIALVSAILTDHSLFTVCKRALISYFTIYIVASLLVLAYRGGVLAETRKEKPGNRGNLAEDNRKQAAGPPLNTPQETS